MRHGTNQSSQGKHSRDVCLKKQVVRLKELGKSGVEIEELTGINKYAVSRIWQTYLSDGVAGIKPKRPGKKKNGHMLLSLEEQREIRQTIISKAPNQLKMAGFLWTLAKISQYIWETYRFIDFMRRLIRDAERKVFFIVDNLRVHHGKLVAAWLEKHKDQIEVFFLPPYAPESNPTEYLNHSLKQDVHSGDLPKTKKDIKHKIHSFMRRLKRKNEKVRAFFRHKKLAYIIATI